MPFADLDHCKLHYELEGASGSPVLVLCHSLGADLSLWDAQVALFVRRFRLLRYDLRGHGRSSVSSEPTTMQALASDVIALADAVSTNRFSFCGISIGGMIGLELALRYPGRLNALVIANTAARIGTSESWEMRIRTVQAHGMQSVVEPALERWFTPEFRSSHSNIVEHFGQVLANTAPAGYLKACEAIRDADLRSSISEIQTPALVIAGSEDSATTVEDAQFLVHKMASSIYREMRTAHLSNVEGSEEFSDAVFSFLVKRDGFSEGMDVRRAVLGDAHVDRSLQKLNDFNREFQDLITRYAWGEIWTRPGLPRHTRSLVTLGMMIALNRTEEFRLHARAAFNNGVTREEIKELLLHAAVYCGVPAANSAFHAAEEVFAEMEQTRPDTQTHRS